MIGIEGKVVNLTTITVRRREVGKALGGVVGERRKGIKIRMEEEAQLTTIVLPEHPLLE